MSNNVKLDREEQQRQDKIRAIETIINTLERNFKRHESVDDPVIRYTLLVDKLCLAVDLAMAALDNFSDDVPDNLKSRITNLSSHLNNDLISLMEWIRQPVYSPDHPHGQFMMRQSQQSFNNHNSQISNQPLPPMNNNINQGAEQNMNRNMSQSMSVDMNPRLNF